MDEYDVIIQATVTKTVRVDADNEDEATQLAHQIFTVQSQEGEPEKYDEQTLSCHKVPNID